LLAYVALVASLSFPSGVFVTPTWTLDFDFSWRPFPPQAPFYGIFKAQLQLLSPFFFCPPLKTAVKLCVSLFSLFEVSGTYVS